MPLVSMLDLLRPAHQRGYAVGAFDIPTLEFLEGIVQAAETLNSPAILAVAEVHYEFLDIRNISHIIRKVAERSPIPMALHLDHGLSFETVVGAVQHGFTSVMIDASAEPYEKNVEMTREVVRVAHAAGCTVEAELGHVGGQEQGQTTESVADRSLFTDVEQAVEFVRRTGCDCLAVAIGSVHGRYKGAPQLDFDRLRQLRQALDVPLVLHGGSGISDEDFRRLAREGVSKVNIYTQMTEDASARIKKMIHDDPEIISVPHMMVEARKAVQEAVMSKMRVFGSQAQCVFQDVQCTVPRGPYSQEAAPAPEPSTSNMNEDDVVRVVSTVIARTLKEVQGTL